MEKRTTTWDHASRVDWGNLEEWVRVEVQELVQRLLEEEVTELPGREKSQRRQVVDSMPGYTNGHGMPQNLTLGCGTITVQRPRVRGLEKRFESRVLPMFARRTPAVSNLIPEPYLGSLGLGTFDLALRRLPGEDAPISASTAARLEGGWQAEWEEWKKRPMDGVEVLYMLVDGIYVIAGLAREKAALLVMVGALWDGRKVILTLEPGYRESTESRSGVLPDLRERGMNCPRLVIGNGNLGIRGALANVYPEAAEQRCWKHKIVNVMDRPSQKAQPQAKQHLRSIAYAESRPEAEENRDIFLAWCRKEGHRSPGEPLVRDWELMLAEQRSRRLDAPEKLIQSTSDAQSEKQQESSRKRYLSLPDIYTLIDKISS